MSRISHHGCLCQVAVKRYSDTFWSNLTFYNRDVLTLNAWMIA